MLNQILKAVFGTKSQRDLKKMLPLVRRINQLEVEYQKLTDEELQAKTPEFKQRLANGETLDDLLCEAFAVVKNACRRMVGREVEVCGQKQVWDMVPFDVQLMGGIALHRGGIAEMATGDLSRTAFSASRLSGGTGSSKNMGLNCSNSFAILIPVGTLKRPWPSISKSTSGPAACRTASTQRSAVSRSLLEISR